MTSPTLRRVRRALMFVASLLLVVVAWEVYKAIGPEKGGSILGWRILPRTDDRSMPHVSDMVSRLFDPVQRGSDEKIWVVVLKATWFSFRLSLAGFAIGIVAGLLLAVVMTRFQIVERGILPYLVVSQTIPLIALAPVVVQWGGKVHIGGWEWPRWLSAAVLGAFLAFFPIAVGALRGLKSAAPASLELMDSLAAPWHQTLWKLRFPAAVPYLIPSLKLAASASVIGVVVAEISTGLNGGLGRLIIEYARQATSDPAKVYTALFGTALLGLAMAGIVAATDSVLMRNRPKEST
jgi:NitT/TauT family transport system permease protein